MSLGHSSKFQPVSRLGFITAPMSHSGGQQNFARCLAISWAGTLYIHSFASCKIHFASKSCVLLYCQRYCTAVEQRPSAKLCGVVQGMELGNFGKRRHLYSAGRPSRWASAHILVVTFNVGYNIGKQPIDRVSEVPDLGIIVDSSLKFTSHINSIVSKANGRAALIRKCCVT